jgi:hypothetical protein
MSTQPVERLAAELDKPTATLIVSDSPQTKRFILESLLTAAALYLLKRYADTFLEGLGFDDMAKEHGKKTKEFIESVRSGAATPAYIDQNKQELESTIAFIKSKPSSKTAHTAALAAVEAEIIESGGVRAQARNVAALVAEAALSSDE